MTATQLGQRSGSRVLRIALWCAAPGAAMEHLLAAFARRRDCVVSTGVPTLSELTRPLPEGASISVHAHLCRSPLPSVDWEWLGRFRHLLLIENPRHQLAAVLRDKPHPVAEDFGLPQQNRLFERIADRFVRPGDGPAAAGRGAAAAVRQRQCGADGRMRADVRAPLRIPLARPIAVGG